MDKSRRMYVGNNYVKKVYTGKAKSRRSRNRQMNGWAVDVAKDLRSVGLRGWWREGKDRTAE